MIIVWIVLILIFVSFALIVAVGAPFVPTKKGQLQKLFEHIKLRRGSRVIDLGSGDGRVLALAKKHGYKPLGYELNPILAAYSMLRLGKQGRGMVKIKSYWSADVSRADMVFIFSAQPYMNRLLNKLEKELKPGSLVISYGFSFPSRKIDEKFEGFNIYHFWSIRVFIVQCEYVRN